MRSPFMKRVVALLQKCKLLENRYIGGAVTLHSRAGCQQQDWHYDYDPVAVASSHIKPLGVIIALENDTKVKRALSVTSDIDFYQYKINFDLIKN